MGRAKELEQYFTDRNQRIAEDFITNNWTLDQAGKAYGLTRERIRQILKEAGQRTRHIPKGRPPRKYRLSPADKLKNRTVKAGDCILWLGGLYKKSYGYLFDNGKRYYTHRYKWILERGELGTDRLLNQCGNDHCLNLDHWKRVTREEADQYLAHYPTKRKKNG